MLSYEVIAHDYEVVLEIESRGLRSGGIFDNEGRASKPRRVRVVIFSLNRADLVKPHCSSEFEDRNLLTVVKVVRNLMNLLRVSEGGIPTPSAESYTSFDVGFSVRRSS